MIATYALPIGQQATLLHGDCLDVMGGMDAESVDAIVTDPPYGLKFMGKRWDHGVPSAEVWREAMRVLKPGGHMLAFGGTRTYHRLVCAIEDAGFEIRDQIAWIYGSGFPKSLDVSKAIDMGKGENDARMREFTAWMRSTGISAAQINSATGSQMASHYLTDKQQPAIATADMFDKLRPYLPEVPERIERLVAERTGIEWIEYKNRNVVGSKVMNDTKHSRPAVATAAQGIEKTRRALIEITAPSTPEARKWLGWGTALKPAHEPIVLARKPLAGTMAANILAHGTGALNIDGCRALEGDEQGRWPANLIHDGSDEATAIFPKDAARFFYCAKASKADREDGLDHREPIHRPNGNKWTGQDYRVISGERPPSAESGPRRNHHPTVKPTELMRYLCRLITPPGGTVLDPFMGSGSTGRGAALEGFGFIGIEIDPDYLAISEARIKAAGAVV